MPNTGSVGPDVCFRYFSDINHFYALQSTPLTLEKPVLNNGLCWIWNWLSDYKSAYIEEHKNWGLETIVNSGGNPDTTTESWALKLVNNLAFITKSKFLYKGHAFFCGNWCQSVVFTQMFCRHITVKESQWLLIPFHRSGTGQLAAMSAPVLKYSY